MTMKRVPLVRRCNLLSRRIDNLPVDVRAEVRRYHRNATAIVDLVSAGLVSTVTGDGLDYLIHLEARLSAIDNEARALADARSEFGL